MTDRELLEKAAKAAGITLKWHEVALDGYGFPVEPMDKEWCYIPSAVPPFNRREEDKFKGEIWNPLTDDADAFRLMVKLNLDVHFWPEHPNPWVEAMAQDELLGTDPYAATRRAIVRAAAVEVLSDE